MKIRFYDMGNDELLEVWDGIGMTMKEILSGV